MHADDDSDRADLLSRIDQKLGEAASSLSRVSSASSPSDVDDASSDIREVERAVDQLSDKKGDVKSVLTIDIDAMRTAGMAPHLTPVEVRPAPPPALAPTGVGPDLEIDGGT